VNARSKAEYDELRQLCREIGTAVEGGIEYVALRDLNMPPHCSPARVDALLCPAARDGYATRLFFASRVRGGGTPNWNGSVIRILEENWYVFSYKDVSSDLRLAQILAAHIRGLG
jgi:hypothetical protein